MKTPQPSLRALPRPSRWSASDCAGVATVSIRLRVRKAPSGVASVTSRPQSMVEVSTPSACKASVAARMNADSSSAPSKSTLREKSEAMRTSGRADSRPTRIGEPATSSVRPLSAVASAMR